MSKLYNIRSFELSKRVRVIERELLMEFDEYFEEFEDEEFEDEEFEDEEFEDEEPRPHFEANEDGILTPEGFAVKMANIIGDTDGDTETRHWRLDDAMCDLLESLGYGEGVEIFRRTYKWYA